jgi:pimeloyl-ACP methyl ester carboxylesterase
MASDKITEVPLESIRLIECKSRTIPADVPNDADEEHTVYTPFGSMRVVVHGDKHNPAIVTYHDLGLNSTSCFQGFFNYPDMKVIAKHFCIYHLNALGQQEGASTLPDGLGFAEPNAGAEYVYPTMDELAKMIVTVVDELKIRAFIGFGVGAGANVLSRFALACPERVEALVLVNCSASQAGWIEWGYQKWNAWYLKSGMMTTGVEEYMLWHWFGNKTLENNHDLVAVYLDYMKSINPTNLGHFVSSYIQRTDLGITRELDPSKKGTVKNFSCPVMLVAGDYSPHLDDTVAMNSRLDPSNSTWMKFECGGMVLEEAPGKLSEAFRLFLQGMGYVPTVRAVKSNP